MDTNRLSACSFPLKTRDLDYTLLVISESGFEKMDLVARMPHFSMTDRDITILIHWNPNVQRSSI